MLTLLVSVLAIVSVSTGFLLDDDSVTSLLAALREEKQARADLEAELLILRTDVAKINSMHQSAQCTCPPSTAVAFSATLTSDILNLGDSQPIVFDKVITNVGGAYDIRHGAFRAPVGGTYKFTFSALQGTADMWVQLELVRNGAVVMGRVKTGADGFWDMGTNIVNVRLDAGDDVWVQHTSNLGSLKLLTLGGGFTMFTGHLVAANP